METTEPLITVENLRVVFSRERKRAFALRGIDIDLFKNEAADLLYHLLILLRAKNVTFEDIEEVLKERHKGRC